MRDIAVVPSLCSRCGANDHRAVACPIPMYKPFGALGMIFKGRGAFLECYNCGEFGHPRAKCPLFGKIRAIVTGELSENEQLVVSQVTELYKGLNTGYGISNEEKDAVKANGGSDTYGELPPSSTMRLLRTLGLTAQDAFFDLGSGVGKVVLCVALATDARQSVGLELSETRVQSNIEAIARAKLENRCGAYVEDFLTSARMVDATVCYCCNLTLPNETFAQLLERMVDEMPRLRLLATLKHPFRETNEAVGQKFAGAFKGAGTLILSTSWERRTQVYLYKRR